MPSIKQFILIGVAAAAALSAGGAYLLFGNEARSLRHQINLTLQERNWSSP
jgi:hypothetical protein